jgi:hypothetical protein
MELTYSFTLSLTSALDWGGQRHAPAALPTEKRPSTHCIEGWLNPRAGLDGCGKSCPPPGFDPPSVQPVASRYTDWVLLQPTAFEKEMLFFVSCYHYSVSGWQRIIQSASKDSFMYLWNWDQTSCHRECIRTRNLPNTNKSQLTTRRFTFRSIVWHWASRTGTPWCPHATKYAHFK